MSFFANVLIEERMEKRASMEEKQSMLSVNPDALLSFHKPPPCRRSGSM